MSKKARSVRKNNISMYEAAETTNPELIFGVVGPIGVNLDHIIDFLKQMLSSLKYKSSTIHLTELIKHDRITLKIDYSSYYKKYKSLISYSNEFRRIAKNPAAMAGIAMLHIRLRRSEHSGSPDLPSLGRAYIIRQFKRAEEVLLMRRVYGRKFIQISVFGGEKDRRLSLIDKIKRYDSSPKTDDECEKQAIDLISIDYNQKDDDNGQRLSEVFHLGDVFVDGIDKLHASSTIERFIYALFGDNRSSPNRDEYGLYTATSASLRSVDLSRQVGAAIFSKRGEVISLGCNEVPKAGGGTYWSDEAPNIYRDVELGGDPNQLRRNEIVFDFLQRMKNNEFLSNNLKSIDDMQKIVERVISNEDMKDSQFMDIIEYGRIIHAEMSAISDASRIGRPTLDAVLYCTTFPCHICAKHIVAAGIDRVVFLEPYPKSYAQKLHSDSITFDPAEDDKVLFQPFLGISPRRYRDIFEKKKRKDKDGKANKWYEGKPVPLIEDRSPTYIDNEEPAAYIALRDLRSETTT